MAGKHGTDYSEIRWLRRPRARLRDAPGQTVVGLFVVPIAFLADGLRRISNGSSALGVVEALAVAALLLVLLYLIRPPRRVR